MMDLAKTLTSWKERSPEQWVRSVNRALPPVVMAILLLAIAYQLAKLTWSLVPRDAFDRPTPEIVQPAASTAPRSAAHYTALQESHLFGEARAEPSGAPAPVTSEVDAPETTLPLTLTGVTADESDQLSQAHIISGRAEERRYRVGDEIENANGARLHAVYRDRVIINRAGQLETLRFDETRTAAAPSRLAPLPPPPEPPPVYDVAEPAVRNVVTESAADLTNILRMAPHLDGGRMVGFRLNPGRDRETFEALGLMPGDVVTDINGVALDDPAKALQVLDALGESTQASITLLRDGVPSVMVIDTSQIQSLMNDRQ